MKKFNIFITIMVLSLAFILSACGTTKTSGSEEKSNEIKTLRVVTDAAYAPFEYMDKGKIVGFDVDFLNAVAKEAGYKVNIEHVGWDPLFVELKGKTADLGISAITINDKRKQTYDFSNPYFLSTNMILVPEGSTIKSADDLKDKVVAVQNGTTGQEVVEKILGTNSPNVKKFENNNLAIMELKDGGAKAVVADNTVVEAYAKNNPNDKLVTIADTKNFSNEFYGLMFPKGSKLKADFDKSIAKVIDNGTYTKLYKQWFKVNPDVKTLKTQQ
ncbi:basic amino acid ABC transporter substrate-binding protein [Neobacillus sp. PS3-40]|uniref:basic amino acid ABC transporter substrate-binding protein n=1 Tax=Neobacillus sp. PS3-40 TaxID=3070679 RepID=UPI0027DF1EFB|nr:basic amino acid ABC transporter substrate-binding protein [Neobacillus sp. PS3-40]WML42894.1 basic amino acid ABC transporter substrate-binding protein [Neobacillus sp. PS3-40]